MTVRLKKHIIDGKRDYQTDEVARNDAIQSLKQIIDKFNKLLQNNPSFGTNGKSAIPVTMEYQDFLAPEQTRRV